jgi:DNA-binding LacI/PurR family transcriptional regulator
VFETRSRLYAGYLIEPLLRSQPPPDVLMLTSDDEVAPVANACRLLGVDPARAPLITGYDNMYRQLPERAFEPLVPVFTVDKCNVRIGASMVSLLQQRIAGTLPPDPQLVILEPLLVVPAAAGA